jgi:hypothetical protein
MEWTETNLPFTCKEGVRYKSEGRGFESRLCRWNFSLTSFRPHYGPGVDSAPNRNEYQEYFLRGKVAGASAQNPIVLKSGSNFLEPSGPVQVCNGIAVSLICNEAFLRVSG